MTTNTHFKQTILFMLIFASLFVLTSCSDLTITGNVVKEYNGNCNGGNIITKVLKSQEIKMCCFNSVQDNREIRSCKSDDLLFSELTIIEDNLITQRKIVYPLEDMICTDVYGRLNPTDTLELISDLSSCS